MKLKGSPHYWMMTGKKPNYIKEGVKTYGATLSSPVNFFQYAGHSAERKTDKEKAFYYFDTEGIRCDSETD